MKKIVSLVLISMAATALFAACGEDDGIDCCVDGRYYYCEDEEAYETCNSREQARDCVRDSFLDDNC